MPLHKLYYDIEMRGVKVDFSRRKELTKKYELRQKETHAQLTNLLGYELNSMSAPQVAVCLFKGLKCPHRAAVDNDTIVALLGNNIKDERRVKILNLILDDRRLRKLLGTYLYASLDFDGRMRTSYRIDGTETGRTSTGILKAPRRMEKIGWAFQTITKSGDFGEDLRSILIPDDGMEFAEIDSSQAEARVVALLANDSETLNLFNSGIDVHSFTASKICGIPIESVGKDSAERFLGKRGRHSYNYDIGKRELMLTINSDAKRFHVDLVISEFKASQILKKLDALMPNVRGVFHKEVERILSETRTLETPFGRKRTFFDRWSDKLKKESYAYLPQSTVADNTKRAMLMFKRARPDIDILIESHDSFLVQYPTNQRDTLLPLLRMCMELPIDFKTCSLSRGTLSIPSEIKIGPNWKDLHGVT